MGLRYLAPRQRIIASYGSAIELLAGDTNPTSIRATYRSPTGNNCSEIFILDPRRFEGMHQVVEDSPRKTADALEKISKTLDAVTELGAIRMVSQTKKQRNAELDDYRKRATAQRARQTDRGPDSQNPQD